MKRITVFFAAGMFALCLSACSGQFTGDTYQFFDDAQLGNSGEVSAEALDTVRGGETRTRGLETDFPTPGTGWPPNELIAINFPPSMETALPGMPPGEGMVTETKWSLLEKGIVYEINKFRQNPVEWCRDNGLPSLDGIRLESEFLGAIPRGPRSSGYRFPAQILYPSSGLHRAALHQAARGVMAHSDISRVNVYVNFSGWGENVGTYSGMTGQASNRGYAPPAAMIVNEFIRDRGVADKGHRVNMANPDWNRVGVGCYKNIVVIQFGYGVQDR
jgi:hypothetical protein